MTNKIFLKIILKIKNFHKKITTICSDFNFLKKLFNFFKASSFTSKVADITDISTANLELAKNIDF